jgi:hypothetical protein
MLEKERLTALSKGVTAPGSDSFSMVPVKEWKFDYIDVTKIVSISGLILFFGGIGMGIGFFQSTRLKEWASLAWIPSFVGAGLLLYLLIAREYFKEGPRS